MPMKNRKRIYLGKDENGIKQYKNVSGRTQKEAMENKVRTQIALHKGVDVSAERDTFYAWALRWLSTKKLSSQKGKLSEQRYQKYAYCVESQLDALRYTPITKIRAYDIQDIINALAEENPHTGKPSAEKTLRDVVSVVRQIFDLAIANRVTEFNPTIAVEIPVERSEPVRRALTYEEQGWIQSTPHRARRAAMIMMYAGLRRGELIPLTWGDIDFAAKTININKSVIMKNGKSILQEGKAKTAGSIRTIDMPDILSTYLQSERPKGASQSDLVCTSVKGAMLSDSGWKRMWSSYLADLNLRYGDIPKEIVSKHNPNGVPFKIPNITAHWLRHTFITMMYLAGVDVMTAMQQAGHADIKTTLGIYTHLDKEFKRNNMEKLNAYIKEKNTL